MNYRGAFLSSPVAIAAIFLAACSADPQPSVKPPTTGTAPASSTAVVPTHTPNDLKNGLWWVDRAEAEIPAVDTISKVHAQTIRAVVFARQKKEKQARTALDAAAAMIGTPTTTTTYPASIAFSDLDAARQRVDRILQGHDDYALSPMPKKPVAPGANDSFAKAAELRKKGDTKGYDVARAPFVAGVKDAKDESSRQSAQIDLFVFDAKTRNFDAAATDADSMQFEEKGWVMFLMGLSSDALDAGDLEALRFYGALCIQKCGMNGPQLLPLVISAHADAGQFETLLQWILKLPNARLRIMAYLSVAEAAPVR